MNIRFVFRSPVVQTLGVAGINADKSRLSVRTTGEAGRPRGNVERRIRFQAAGARGERPKYKQLLERERQPDGAPLPTYSFLMSKYVTWDRNR